MATNATVNSYNENPDNKEEHNRLFSLNPYPFLYTTNTGLGKVYCSLTDTSSYKVCWCDL